MSAQHAGDCTTNPKWDFVRSQLPSWPYPRREQHSRATCDSKWESVPASAAVWGQEIHSRAVQPGTAHLLALKASSTLLSRQTKQQRHMSRHGKSLHFSHGGCTLVRWLNTSCLMQMCPSSLQRGISWRQLHPVCLWTAETDHVLTILEHGIQDPKESCGEELNNSNILSSEENKTP